MATTDDVEPDPADLIAELDAEPDPAQLDDSEPGEPAELFTGRAYGGPCDGALMSSRYPGGFLWVDRQQQTVWVYDRRDDGVFTTRERAYTLVEERRWKTAMGEEYDVLVPGMAGPESEGP